MKFHLTLTIERRGWFTHRMLSFTTGELICVCVTLASFAAMGVMLAWHV